MKTPRRCCKALTRVGALLVATGIYTTTASACVLTPDWVEMVSENPSKNRVLLKNVDLPVAIGKPFTVQLAVCADNSKTVQRVSIDATMPAHKHGMNYKPDIKEIETGSKYKASGMFFHMPGQWQISVDIYSVAGGERFLLNVPAR